MPGANCAFFGCFSSGRKMEKNERKKNGEKRKEKKVKSLKQNTREE